MKIGLVIYGTLDTLSGGYLYDRKLVESLRAAGDTVKIISLPWRSYPTHLADNLTFRLPHGFDLIIEDELNHPSLLAANRRKPCPVISLVHHLRCSEQRPAWQNTFYQLVERAYLRSVDGFIFNSMTTRNVVHALAGRGKPSIVAYPPTDRFGSALPEAWVAARAAEPTPLRLVFLGNVIPRKGLHTLLEALARLPAGATTLDIIGGLNADPAYAAAMQEKAGSLSSTAQFHGALDNVALQEKLRLAHILVVPSSYEGFGIVYLEGMAFGLPAIGTTAGAAGEIITHENTGYLIPPNDSAELSSCLATLAHNRNLLAHMSLNALARYRQQPTWQSTAARVREFLFRFAMPT